MTRKEKLILVNGNGQKYTLGLPQIVLLDPINDVALKHLEENTGLKFEKTGWEHCRIAYSTNSQQIVKLFMTYNFRTKYYNNYSVKNTIFLKHCGKEEWEG